MSRGASYACVLLLSIFSVISFEAIAQTEPLFVSQSIKFDTDQSDDITHDLEELFLLKPNRRFLGVTWRLHTGKLFSNEFTEDPVVWDEEKILRTAFRIKKELSQLGFLNCEVEIEKQVKRRGVAAVYRVHEKKRWTVGEINWIDDNSGLHINRLKEESLLKTGDYLDVTLLKAERERISEYSQGDGFATFNEAFIHFEVDTTGGLANLDVMVRGQSLGSHANNMPHKKMKIGSVFYDQSKMSKPIEKRYLEYLSLLVPDGRFAPSDFENTYRKISLMPAVKSVKILKDFPLLNSVDYGVVDVTVELISAKRYDLALELDMTRADTRYGPLARVTWTDRNVTGKGDMFSWTAMASIASTQPFSYNDNSIVPNSGEFGLQVAYKMSGIPPIPIDRLPKSTRAKSEWLLNLAKESRPEYSRNLFDFKYVIDWVVNFEKNSIVSFSPLQIRYVDMTLSDDFDQWVNGVEDPLMAFRFSDYSIAGGALSWSQQTTTKWNTLQKLAASIEWSGMIAPDGIVVNGVSLVEYYRGEVSFVQKGSVFNVDGRDWAARIRLGGAFTGAKTEVIPYDRGFFGGGANGVRGWPIRMLGPSSLGMGSLRADASAELRMKWTDANAVALFSDVGNVWNKSNIELADIAWSVGLGFRYDFDFFLLRLDTALRIHDPMKPIGERWIYQSKIVGGIHLGLGHPF